eukprot:CAMPEP_0118697266 /NCGR_PEP_ID=MMETSP0800-20121206/14384_1 /TAXON_ID=210618 ORGANISM="Striatella unipunctata, Strain CCMP2910" /NCGR_SAMPLE_ID=MMETSP0800 /ASSEMBLY_ACC=CAM_ASM_000638 /LENGTH=194 /DNA_ID=CAMNT_0006596625 /DNA_START=235 /DNA_END=819 /DNA_ORIENTATION=+
MSSYGEPDWTTPAAPQGTSASPAPNNAGAEPAGSGSSGSCLLRFLSIVNIGIGGMMATLAVLGILSIDEKIDITGDLSLIFVSAYMLIFALLLVIYEAMWWSAIPSLNRSMRKNFGFMYSFNGKAFYMIFIAFMTLGLESVTSVELLRYATGVAFLAMGVFHLFLAFTQPEVVDKYRAPVLGLVSTSSPDPSAV